MKIMSQYDEYAKLVRGTTRDTTTRGFQAKLSLPSSVTLLRTGDYYCFSNYIIYVISILVLRGDIMDKKRNIALCAEA